jgi:hypothetical protein
MSITTVSVPPPVSGPTAPAPVTPPATTTSERPAWLPEKFKSPEDMAAAYSALETKLGAGQTQTPPVTDPKAGQQPPANDPTKTQQQTPPANVDMDALSKEFAEKDKLEDTTYQALEAKGFSRKVVDNYIAGQQAIAARIQNEVYTSVGGEQNYMAMIQWAQGNLKPEEATAFDDAVTSGDMAKISFAVAGLNAKFTAANGREPSLVGGAKAPTGPAPFQSTHEVTQAMRDPRYAKDAAYRAGVEARLAASTIFG